MREFTTRKPDGRPSWPVILLAGIEGSGKTYAAAEASGLPMFGRSLFLEIGEDKANEYGGMECANYEIIEHDGTERQIIQAAQWAAEQPQVDGKPSLLIIDSMTELWQVIQDEQQRIANQRAMKKGRSNVTEATITMDQWNAAKDKFNDVVAACRRFPGPVILTARLDNVSVVEGGSPTGEKVWKVRSEKNLPFHASVIMQAREVRKWTMTKVASRELVMPPEGYLPWPDFTVEELLIRLGIDVDTDVSPSTYVRPRANDEEGASANASEPTLPPSEFDGMDLPANLPEVVAGLEEQLNRDELFRLYKLAESLANRNVPRARTHMARIEAAGKRVARRLEAGDKPATTPEPEAPTSDVQEEPQPSPPEEETRASQEEVNKDSGQPIDPASSRRKSQLRDSTIGLIESDHESPEKANEWVFAMIGLEIDQASTKRLQELAQGVER